MKYIATVAMASALALAGGAALADPNNGGNGNPPPHHQDNGKGGQKPPPKGAGGGQGGNGQGGNNQGGANHGGNGQFTPQGVQGGAGQGGNGQGGNGQNRFRGPTGQFTPQGGGQGGNGRPGFNGQSGGHGAPGFLPGNHPLRAQDRGRVWFSVNLFPHNYHVTRRYHYRPYNYPQGWYQQVWGYGQFLPFGWYDQQYYLDWNYFGLPKPPIGCEWVRVGSDALLVDVWTGEVLSVSQGLFW